MTVTRFNPQAVVQQALQAAEQVLDRAAPDGNVTGKIAAQLPPALQQASDSFGAGSVTKAEVLQAFVQSLEGQLSQSLAGGAFVPGEVEQAIDSLSFSRLGVQLSQLMQAQAAPATLEGAEANARLALQTADTSVTSQLEAFAALKGAAEAHAADNPHGAVAKLLATMVKERGKLMQKVVDTLVRDAERADANLPDAGTKETLQVAVAAALDVHKTVAPKGARTKALAQKQQQLGAPDLEQAAQQPFFARFLENQNAKQGEPPVVDQRSRPGDMVTMKFPSDAEDHMPDEREDWMVTKKFPSDNDEDIDLGDLGKVDSDGSAVEGEIGDVMVTRKYPSDNDEDWSNEDGADLVTMKFPSDNEDDVSTPNDPIFTTMKFPSDNEDSPVSELRPEMVVELAPEMVPELRPGPDPLTPASRSAMRTEQAVNKAAYYGEEKLIGRAEEIADLLTRALVGPAQLENLQRERDAISVFLGGMPGLEQKIAELKDFATRARLDEPAYQQLMAEIAMYEGLHETFAGHQGRLDALAERGELTPAERAEQGVLTAAMQGFEAMDHKQIEISDMLHSGTVAPFEVAQLELEAAGLKAYRAGAPAIEDMLEDLNKALANFCGTAEEQQQLTQKIALYEAIVSTMGDFRERSLELDRRLDGLPTPIPEVAPEVLPRPAEEEVTGDDR